MTEPAAAVTKGALGRLARLLEADFGLRFTAANSDLIERGLHAVAQEQRLPMATLVRGILNGDAALLHLLAVKSTVRETYFFRHSEHFAALVEHVVPALLHSGRTTLRAWSAGCASGEEAYCLAAALRAAAPAAEVTVLGTDLNPDALATATQGTYGRRSWRGEPPRWSLRLPLHVTTSGVGVPALLRDLVQFHALNLNQSSYPEELVPKSSFDVIFCRNVLVYFAPEAAAKVVLQLRDRLREGGYLFLAALDYTAVVPGMVPVNLGGVQVLRKAAVDSERKSYAHPARDVRSEAKAAADSGDHELATRLLRDALHNKRTPELLHLLALVRKECGQLNETLVLLTEATALAPDYALGHLSLGLIALESPLRDEQRARRHLTVLLSLLERRGDTELLPGPEPIAAGLARLLASTALRKLSEAS